MAKQTSLGLALAIMALSAWGIYSALDWPLKSRLFPLVIAIPLFCLATAEALWVIFAKDAAASASDFKLSEGQPREVFVASGAHPGAQSAGRCDRYRGARDRATPRRAAGPSGRGGEQAGL